jgi:AraC-like DNA-binding protein/quercetin dioxygenase-like cupin family protein
VIDKLPSKLFVLNDSEKHYLNDSGYQSPIYEQLDKIVMNNQEVYKFQLPNLQQNLIEIRRDSRFTNVPLHIHSNLNINYIYSGSCHYQVNDTEIALEKGDLCIVDRNVVRSKGRLGEEDIIFNISLSNDFFSRAFIIGLGETSILSTFLFSAITENNQHDGYLIFQKNHHDTIVFLNQLICEYFQKDSFSKNAIEALFSLIFIKLIRGYQQDSTKKMAYINNKTNHMLEIIDYIEKNAATCTLTETASKFNYHPKYLSQLIKQTFNKTFKEIQTEQRMKNAVQLLRYSELSIAEISLNIGISNVNQFYKNFSKIYDSSPNEYRKSFIH